MTIYERALELIDDRTIIGLGSGRASRAFVQALAGRVRAGMHVRGVATSPRTAELAASLGVPLTTLDTVDRLDAAVDGADEVDPQLNLIKGLGGALVREKIVAASARRLIILVGEEKLVPVLGGRGTLPVEVVPFGLALCTRRLAELGLPSAMRMAEGRPFTTDNGNRILDCQVGPIADPSGLEQKIRAIPGVVGTGLFLGMADLVLVGDEQFNLTAEKRGGSA
jgi:ribose 5-phosphate isomerase A